MKTLEQQLVEAKQEQASNPVASEKLARRINQLEQYIKAGAVIHSDGYIRYPNRPTLLGYD